MRGEQPLTWRVRHRTDLLPGTDTDLQLQEWIIYRREPSLFHKTTWRAVASFRSLAGVERYLITRGLASRTPKGSTP